MVLSQKIMYAKPFEGEPNDMNFRLEFSDLPTLEDGEISCEAEYISVDPYARLFMDIRPVDNLIIGAQIAKVTESRNQSVPVGAYIHGNFGWRTRTVLKPILGNSWRSIDDTNSITIIPDQGEFPLSLSLGYLGMPGGTAYFGFLEILQPKPGETIVITAAAGAVGSLVGQIAKIKDCKVIAFAGTDAKCHYLAAELGFDFAYNYKTEDIAECLQSAAPNGVDMYFDNVGGEISSIVISKMRNFGRIAVCGSISSYNKQEATKSTTIQGHFVLKQLRMEGFIFYKWADRFQEAIDAIKQWIRDGKIKYKETITQGFSNTPQAFAGMLRGDSVGKAIVKVKSL